MAAGVITITAARQHVVNFVRPFTHVGLTVVVKKPAVVANIPYSFGIFQPLDPAVWGLIVLALTVVSMTRPCQGIIRLNWQKSRPPTSISYYVVYLFTYVVTHSSQLNCGFSVGRRV